MKTVLKQLSVLTAILALAFLAVLCCCYTDMVKAQSPVSSCHQAADREAPSPDSQDCDCDEVQATVQKISPVSPDHVLMTWLDNTGRESRFEAPVYLVRAFQAPPPTETIPLYLKNSTFLL